MDIYEVKLVRRIEYVRWVKVKAASADEAKTLGIKMSDEFLPFDWDWKERGRTTIVDEVTGPYDLGVLT